MRNTIVSSVIAGGLFITGCYLLRSIKHKQPISTVVDTERNCNETDYLAIGVSEEPITPANSEEKVVHDDPFSFGPDEEFSVIANGETLHRILRPKGVSEREIAAIGLALRPYLRPRDLAAGDLYRYNIVLVEKTNIIENFIIRKLDSNRVPILYTAERSNKNINDAKFTVKVHEPIVTEEFGYIALQVKGTLYQTFSQIEFGNELMQRLMGVFAWKMQMPKEVLPGDKIEILVTKKFTLGKFIGYGQIQSVSYQQPTRTLSGTFFQSSDKKIKGFFDNSGKSLEKEFALSPVYETTATSNQRFRKHPILKVRIRHNGVDYRGTVGTPFYSIADGEVIEKRYDDNVGNMIRIRHRYGVHSEYFHADSLVPTINVGDRVRRGQNIGTIGRTGRLCTGPHLHMGLYTMRGKTRNYIEFSSLRNTLRNAPNLENAYLQEFNFHRNKILAEIDSYKKPQIAEGDRTTVFP